MLCGTDNAKVGRRVEGGGLLNDGRASGRLSVGLP